MSVREKESEKDTSTQTTAHKGERIWEGLEPRTRGEENQSVREALRRIAPQLARRSISENRSLPKPEKGNNFKKLHYYDKLLFSEPEQEAGDIFEKLRCQEKRSLPEPETEGIFEKLLYEFQLAQRIYALQQEKRAWLAEQEEQRKKSVFVSTLELARRGDIAAQKELCKLYQTGLGTQVSESSAFQWILSAAQAGDEEAQRKAGAFFYNGYGTEKNEESGFYWYMCAAEQGSSEAQKRIGDYYSQGAGVQQNLETAFAWYLKAAENGNRGAKYLVGLCYYEGTGVQQNHRLAFQWMKAVAPEHGSARKFLKKHQKELLQFSGEEA